MGVGELTVEKLVQLGIAGGLVECEQARQQWSHPPAFRVKV